MSSETNTYEKSVPLTFGSITSLSSITDTDSFIYVDGFVQDKFLSKNFKSNDPKLIYSKSLFQIYPPLINTNKKRVLDNKTQQKIRSKDMSEQKKIELVTELQDSILTEFKINLENFKKVAGQSVSFEQPVQFLHVASNKFLSCRKTEAQLERQNYKVGLDEYSNDSTVFRFLPCYKHQKDSEGTIFVTDSLYIASVNNILDKVPYLHISNPISVNTKKEKLEVFQTQKKGTKVVSQSASKENQKKKTKIEVNISLESSTRLKINYYSRYLESGNNYLECGDTVWLNHSELAATLVCVTKFIDNQFKFNIQFDGNRVSDHFKQFIGNTNGMWVIENVDYQNGGFIQWNESYRFKHLGSGFYLTVKKTREKNQQEAEYRIVLESELSEDNEFMFIPVPSTLPKSTIHRQYVTKDTFVLLMHKKTKFIIHGNFEKNELSKKNTIGEEASSSFLGEVKPILKKYGEVSEQAAFKIIQANYNEVWETNFLISCFPVLKSFLNKIILANQVDKLYYWSKNY